MHNNTNISSVRDSKYTKINEIIDYKKRTHTITKIKDLPSKFDYETDNTLIEAYIFGIDIIVSERNVTYITLKLSDMTGSIIARLVIPSNTLRRTLRKIKIGTSWRFYGECANKKYDGMNIIKMKQIPKINKSLIDKEQRKYFFFETLNIFTVKKRKKEELKDKALMVEDEEHESIKLFGIDIVKLYDYDVEKSYNLIKQNTDYLRNIPFEKVKEIRYSYDKDIIILLKNGIVLLNGKQILENVKTLAFVNALSIFAITRDKSVIPILLNNPVEEFMNNGNCKYKKIIITPLLLIALTYDGDVRIRGCLTEIIIDYTKYFDVDDIGYVEENDEIVVIKNDKVYSLFSGIDYSNEVPEVMVEGELNDIVII